MLLIEIIVVLALFVLNGFFAMAELAIVTSRRGHLEHLAKEGRPGAQVAIALADDPARMLAAVQMGFTTSATLAGIFSGSTLAERLEKALLVVPVFAGQFVDLEESARTCSVLERTGAWPPPEDMDWTDYAVGHPEFYNLDVKYGLVGMRGAGDEPPWFQFFDQRRTLFEFKDRATIYDELITPMVRHGWQTWDRS